MTTWGYILDAPGRPKHADQTRTLTALGADRGEFSTIWCDKIARGSTRPRSQLRERNALITAVRAGDVVVVAAPLCLGLSAKDAGWLIAELANKGVSLTVADGVTHLEPGESPADLLARVASAQNVNHVRQSKRRAKSK